MKKYSLLPLFAGEADPPEAGVSRLVERAREVDDAHPRHGFERARRGFGERARGFRAVALRQGRGEEAQHVLPGRPRHDPPLEERPLHVGRGPRTGSWS